MKKQYISPSLDIISLQSANLFVGSIPRKQTTDAEARSQEFWGNTLFDEETEEEEPTDSWY